jgi:hypothetical protein
MHARIDEPPYRPSDSNRAAERIPVTLPARLMWKDQRGTTRFACVVTKNVSEFGAYVECPSPISLPVYRLVQFQLEKDVKATDRVPEALRHGRLTAAVYRVTPPDAHGHGQGFALRLMVEPKRRANHEAEIASTRVRATA